MVLLFTPVVGGGSAGGRGEISLAEVQCHLDREGASDLVIDLIMNATSDRIFQESILLAIALLEGGNPVIQVSLSFPFHFHLCVLSLYLILYIILNVTIITV